MGEKENEGVCQECGERKASIYITDFVDGNPVKKHICSACYEMEEGAPPLSSSELFSKLVNIIAPEIRKAGVHQCPECGLDYIGFRQSFKFGCPHDYSMFARALDDLFKDLHGACRHNGKIPEGRAQLLFGGKQRLEVLNRELEKAVESEDFERAAQLKNKIEKVEEASARNTEK